MLSSGQANVRARCVDLRPILAHPLKCLGPTPAFRATFPTCIDHSDRPQLAAVLPAVGWTNRCRSMAALSAEVSSEKRHRCDLAESARASGRCIRLQEAKYAICRRCTTPLRAKVQQDRRAMSPTPSGAHVLSPCESPTTAAQTALFTCRKILRTTPSIARSPCLTPRQPLGSPHSPPKAELRNRCHTPPLVGGGSDLL